MLFKLRKCWILFVLILPVTVLQAQAAQNVVSVKVDNPPVLDGVDNDQAWKAVKPVAIKDQASDTVILLRSVYTDDQIFFSVQFPDSVNNALHKPWVWDQDKAAYETGKHREDTFVFKWNMMSEAVNLSNFSDDNYTADVWYWKANRTNPAGYADDKSQTLSDQPADKATELKSVSGKTRYLVRRSDQGKPAYQEQQPTTFQGEIVDRYPPSIPAGSRADVRAKGRWDNGFWFIEFERNLTTGFHDDLQLDPSTGKGTLFGVSIFSLYGRPHDPNSPNLYGRGRISQPLLLSFEE